jgi:16S rRNA (guanine(1405)-N(7))-methyltransferase
MNHQQLLEEIIKSKKYKNISPELIKNEIKDFIKRTPNFDKLKDKFIIKEIKTRLHKKHASFNILSDNKKISYIEQLKNKPEDMSIIKKILSGNRSTKERIDFYQDLYDKIFEITGKPRAIIDFGCGLNPLSSVYLKKPLVYYGYDINQADAELINSFFKIKGIEGRAFILNLKEVANYQNIPEADLGLMFKFIDTIEEGRNDHKLAEEIVKKVLEKTKSLVVSFAKKTLGGKSMVHSNRGWFERMLKRLELYFRKLEFNNEVFYVIKK